MTEHTLSKTNNRLSIALFIFILWTIWRIFLFIRPENQIFGLTSFAWGSTYQIIAIFGSLTGIYVSKYWGGWGSTFGKTILLFSIGLLFQSIGQGISSFFVYKTGDVPYPSIGDIGFFGSVVFYIFGVLLLAKVSGVKSFAKNTKNKILAILLPILVIAVSYVIFLSDYVYDWSDPYRTFLDFSYPVYQAIYVSIALLTLILSRKYLGGVMKKPVLMFLFALIMQYLSDFIFLYQASRGIYIPEGINDCIYFLSYLLMTIAIIYTDKTFTEIAES